MRARILISGAAALMCALSVASSASAASPSKNTNFKGTASGRVKFATSFIAKDPLTFKVSNNGKDLLSFTFTDNVCGLASSKLVDLGMVKLGANGAFTVSGLKSPPENDATEDGGKIVTTSSVSGAFVSATKAAGTLQYSAKESHGPPSSCGPITLKFSATG